jgi:hypothetical protein
MKPNVPRWKDIIDGLYSGNYLAVYKIVPSPPIVITKSIFSFVVSLLNRLYVISLIVLKDFSWTLSSVFSSRK